MEIKGACNNCRFAHKACNRQGPPCGRCIDNGLEGCSYKDSVIRIKAIPKKNTTPKSQRKQKKQRRRSIKEDEYSSDDLQFEQTIAEANNSIEVTQHISRTPKKARKEKTPEISGPPKPVDPDPFGNNYYYPLAYASVPLPNGINTKFAIAPFDNPEELEQIEKESEPMFPDLPIPWPSIDSLPKAVVKDVPLDEEYLSLIGNRLQVWNKPASYIVYHEKTPEEQDDMVEYDMDSEDEIWLNEFNKDRKKDRLLPVTEDDFEFIVDRLEKESFRKESLVMPSEEDIDVDNTNCSICNDENSDDTNQIVFCDGCDIAVHQECYGIRMIPEGQWFCQKCESREKDVKCVLCPREDGAFKRTVDGRWAHVLCAHAIPETSFKIVNGMRGEIDGLERVAKQRLKFLCEICKQPMGACVQCKERACTAAFHITCAMSEGLQIEFPENAKPRAACIKHTPAKIRKAHERAEKRKRRKKKKKKKFLDLISHHTVSLQHAQKALGRKAPSGSLQPIWEFWVAKRKARSMNPLIKRLTKSIIFSPRSIIKKTGDELNENYRKMFNLRRDLEKCRILLELVKQRERLKQQYIKTLREINELETTPVVLTLRVLLECFEREDKQHLFTEDVSVELYPDYVLKVEKPMSFNKIREMIESYELVELEDFWGHVDLVITNALTYNEPNSIVGKEAKRIQKIIESKKQKLEGIAEEDIIPSIVESPIMLLPEINSVVQSPSSAPGTPIGDVIINNTITPTSSIKRKRGRPKKKGTPPITITSITESPVTPSTEKKLKKKKKSQEKETKKDKAQAEAKSLKKSLMIVLDRLRLADHNFIFHEEVSEIEVPGYRDIIDTPMAISTMERNLKARRYPTLKEFSDDFHLMIHNAKMFNPPGSIFFKDANRMLWIGKSLIDKVEKGKQIKDKPKTPNSCVICKKAGGKHPLTMCNACERGYHLKCTSPPMTTQPAAPWYCMTCDPMKHCAICKKSTLLDLDDVMICKGCDKSFHFSCLPEEHKPSLKNAKQNEDSWFCSECEPFYGDKPDNQINDNENEFEIIPKRQRRRSVSTEPRDIPRTSSPLLEPRSPMMGWSARRKLRLQTDSPSFSSFEDEESIKESDDEDQQESFLNFSFNDNEEEEEEEIIEDEKREEEEEEIQDQEEEEDTEIREEDHKIASDDITAEYFSFSPSSSPRKVPLSARRRRMRG